ncbi:MAG: DUF4097 family beta strand repeat protein, partial [Deltaproteobacteria bacterium]|nr:DUF4097 family beta strand repeat protein [Deltaproteobacteria bacterium]
NRLKITEDSSFRATSGKIDLDFINDMDEFTFDLRSSSGRIEIGSTKAKGKLLIGNGSIRIHGKTSSGDQSYH